MNKTRSLEDALDRIADKLEELAEGGGSSGGDSGSSDFSTAEVTFINSSSEPTFYRVAFTGLMPEEYQEAVYCGQAQVFSGTPFTVTIPLHKGSYKLSTHCFDGSTIDTSIPPATTGEISVDVIPEGTVFNVTGDGTITVAGTGLVS